ncbi:hypothetical protein BaRGS_00008043, partial [Batillaria attramentaria]
QNEEDETSDDQASESRSRSQGGKRPNKDLQTNIVNVALPYYPSPESVFRDALFLPPFKKSGLLPVDEESCYLGNLKSSVEPRKWEPDKLLVQTDHEQTEKENERLKRLAKKRLRNIQRTHLQGQFFVDGIAAEGQVSGEELSEVTLSKQLRTQSDVFDRQEASERPELEHVSEQESAHATRLFYPKSSTELVFDAPSARPWDEKAPSRKQVTKRTKRELTMMSTQKQKSRTYQQGESVKQLHTRFKYDSSSDIGITAQIKKSSEASLPFAEKSDKQKLTKSGSIVPYPYSDSSVRETLGSQTLGQSLSDPQLGISHSAGVADTETFYKSRSVCEAQERNSRKSAGGQARAVCPQTLSEYRNISLGANTGRVLDRTRRFQRSTCSFDRQHRGMPGSAHAEAYFPSLSFMQSKKAMSLKTVREDEGSYTRKHSPRIGSTDSPPVWGDSGQASQSSETHWPYAEARDEIMTRSGNDVTYLQSKDSLRGMLEDKTPSDGLASFSQEDIRTSDPSPLFSFRFEGNEMYINTFKPGADVLSKSGLHVRKLLHYDGTSDSLSDSDDTGRSPPYSEIFGKYKTEKDEDLMPDTETTGIVDPFAPQPTQSDTGTGTFSTVVHDNMRCSKPMELPEGFYMPSHVYFDTETQTFVSSVQGAPAATDTFTVSHAGSGQMADQPVGSARATGRKEAYPKKMYSNEEVKERYNMYSFLSTNSANLSTYSRSDTHVIMKGHEGEGRSEVGRTCSASQATLSLYGSVSSETDGQSFIDGPGREHSTSVIYRQDREEPILTHSAAYFPPGSLTSYETLDHGTLGKHKAFSSKRRSPTKRLFYYDGRTESLSDSDSGQSLSFQHLETFAKYETEAGNKLTSDETGEATTAATLFQTTTLGPAAERLQTTKPGIVYEWSAQVPSHSTPPGHVVDTDESTAVMTAQGSEYLSPNVSISDVPFHYEVPDMAMQNVYFSRTMDSLGAPSYFEDSSVCTKPAQFHTTDETLSKTSEDMKRSKITLLPVQYRTPTPFFPATEIETFVSPEQDESAVKRQKSLSRERKVTFHIGVSESDTSISMTQSTSRSRLYSLQPANEKRHLQNEASAFIEGLYPYNTALSQMHENFTLTSDSDEVMLTKIELESEEEELVGFSENSEISHHQLINVGRRLISRAEVTASAAEELSADSSSRGEAKGFVIETDASVEEDSKLESSQMSDELCSDSLPGKRGTAGAKDYSNHSCQIASALEALRTKYTMKEEETPLFTPTDVCRKPRTGPGYLMSEGVCTAEMPDRSTLEKGTKMHKINENNVSTELSDVEIPGEYGKQLKSAACTMTEEKGKAVGEKDTKQELCSTRSTQLGKRRAPSPHFEKELWLCNKRRRLQTTGRESEEWLNFRVCRATCLETIKSDGGENEREREQLSGQETEEEIQVPTERDHQPTLKSSIPTSSSATISEDGINGTFDDIVDTQNNLAGRLPKTQDSEDNQGESEKAPQCSYSAPQHVPSDTLETTNVNENSEKYRENIFSDGKTCIYFASSAGLSEAPLQPQPHLTVSWKVLPSQSVTESDNSALREGSVLKRVTIPETPQKEMTDRRDLLVKDFHDVSTCTNLPSMPVIAGDTAYSITPMGSVIYHDFNRENTRSMYKLQNLQDLQPSRSVTKLHHQQAGLKPDAQAHQRLQNQPVHLDLRKLAVQTDCYEEDIPEHSEQYDRLDVPFLQYGAKDEDSRDQSSPSPFTSTCVEPMSSGTFMPSDVCSLHRIEQEKEREGVCRQPKPVGERNVRGRSLQCQYVLHASDNQQDSSESVARTTLRAATARTSQEIWKLMAEALPRAMSEFLASLHVQLATVRDEMPEAAICQVWNRRGVALVQHSSDFLTIVNEMEKVQLEPSSVMCEEWRVRGETLVNILLEFANTVAELEVSEVRQPKSAVCEEWKVRSWALIQTLSTFLRAVSDLKTVRVEQPVSLLDGNWSELTGRHEIQTHLASQVAYSGIGETTGTDQTILRDTRGTSHSESEQIRGSFKADIPSDANLAESLSITTTEIWGLGFLCHRKSAHKLSPQPVSTTSSSALCRSPSPSSLRNTVFVPMGNSSRTKERPTEETCQNRDVAADLQPSYSPEFTPLLKTQVQATEHTAQTSADHVRTESVDRHEKDAVHISHGLKCLEVGSTQYLARTGKSESDSCESIHILSERSMVVPKIPHRESSDEERRELTQEEVLSRLKTNVLEKESPEVQQQRLSEDSQQHTPALNINREIGLDHRQARDTPADDTWGVGFLFFGNNVDAITTHRCSKSQFVSSYGRTDRTSKSDILAEKGLEVETLETRHLKTQPTAHKGVKRKGNGLPVHPARAESSLTGKFSRCETSTTDGGTVSGVSAKSYDGGRISDAIVLREDKSFIDFTGIARTAFEGPFACAHEITVNGAQFHSTSSDDDNESKVPQTTQSCSTISDTDSKSEMSQSTKSCSDAGSKSEMSQSTKSLSTGSHIDISTEMIQTAKCPSTSSFTSSRSEMSLATQSHRTSSGADSKGGMSQTTSSQSTISSTDSNSEMSRAEQFRSTVSIDDISMDTETDVKAGITWCIGETSETWSVCEPTSSRMGWRMTRETETAASECSEVKSPETASGDKQQEIHSYSHSVSFSSIPDVCPDISDTEPLADIWDASNLHFYLTLIPLSDRQGGKGRSLSRSSNTRDSSPSIVVGRNRSRSNSRSSGYNRSRSNSEPQDRSRSNSRSRTRTMEIDELATHKDYVPDHPSGSHVAVVERVMARPRGKPKPDAHGVLTGDGTDVPHATPQDAGKPVVRYRSLQIGRKGLPTVGMLHGESSEADSLTVLSDGGISHSVRRTEVGDRDVESEHSYTLQATTECASSTAVIYALTPQTFVSLASPSPTAQPATQQVPTTQAAMKEVAGESESTPHQPVVKRRPSAICLQPAERTAVRRGTDEIIEKRIKPIPAPRKSKSVAFSVSKPSTDSSDGNVVASIKVRSFEQRDSEDISLDQVLMESWCSRVRKTPTDMSAEPSEQPATDAEGSSSELFATDEGSSIRETPTPLSPLPEQSHKSSGSASRSERSKGSARSELSRGSARSERSQGSARTERSRGSARTERSKGSARSERSKGSTRSERSKGSTRSERSKESSRSERSKGSSDVTLVSSQDPEVTIETGSSFCMIGRTILFTPELETDTPEVQETETEMTSHHQSDSSPVYVAGQDTSSISGSRASLVRVVPQETDRLTTHRQERESDGYSKEETGGLKTSQASERARPYRETVAERTPPPPPKPNRLELPYGSGPPSRPPLPKPRSILKTTATRGEQQVAAQPQESRSVLSPQRTSPSQSATGTDARSTSSQPDSKTLEPDKSSLKLGKEGATDSSTFPSANSSSDKLGSLERRKAPVVYSLGQEPDFGPQPPISSDGIGEADYKPRPGGHLDFPDLSFDDLRVPFSEVEEIISGLEFSFLKTPSSSPMSLSNRKEEAEPLSSTSSWRSTQLSPHKIEQLFSQPHVGISAELGKVGDYAASTSRSIMPATRGAFDSTQQARGQQYPSEHRGVFTATPPTRRRIISSASWSRRQEQQCLGERVSDTNAQSPSTSSVSTRSTHTTFRAMLARGMESERHSSPSSVGRATQSPQAGTQHTAAPAYHAHVVPTPSATSGSYNNMQDTKSGSDRSHRTKSFSAGSLAPARVAQDLAETQKRQVGLGSTPDFKSVLRSTDLPPAGTDRPSDSALYTKTWVFTEHGQGARRRVEKDHIHTGHRSLMTLHSKSPADAETLSFGSLRSTGRMHVTSHIIKDPVPADTGSHSYKSPEEGTDMQSPVKKARSGSGSGSWESTRSAASVGKVASVSDFRETASTRSSWVSTTIQPPVPAGRMARPSGTPSIESLRSPGSGSHGGACAGDIHEPRMEPPAPAPQTSKPSVTLSNQSLLSAGAGSVASAGDFQEPPSRRSSLISTHLVSPIPAERMTKLGQTSSQHSMRSAHLVVAASEASSSSELFASSDSPEIERKKSRSSSKGSGWRTADTEAEDFQ